MLQSPPAAFFLQNTVETARQLVGMYLVRKTEDAEFTGRIVESEAYRENEPASHSYRGRTARTEAMFLPGGAAYVYLIYGVHFCFNVVTEPKGTGCAVLIRAVEPVYGIETMWENRFPGKPFDPAKVHTVANGPGKLCSAFGITLRDTGSSLLKGPIRIMADPDAPAPEMSVSTRVGVIKAADLQWRFFDKNSAAVSMYRKGAPRKQRT